MKEGKIMLKFMDEIKEVFPTKKEAIWQHGLGRKIKSKVVVGQFDHWEKQTLKNLGSLNINK